jgi:hypothetical protein
MLSCSIAITHDQHDGGQRGHLVVLEGPDVELDVEGDAAGERRKGKPGATPSRSAASAPAPGAARIRTVAWTTRTKL